MIEINFDVYENTIREMLDILYINASELNGIKKNFGHSTSFSENQYWQWLLRHVFIDIFESTRQFLMLKMANHKSEFEITEEEFIWHTNLDELLKPLKKTKFKNDNDYASFLNKCEAFHIRIRNHLVHAQGLYFFYKGEKQQDYEFEFPAGYDVYSHNVISKLQESGLKGRLSSKKVIFSHNKAIPLDGCAIVNLIMYMRLHVCKILKTVFGESFNEESIDGAILQKLKYIYDILG